MQEPEPKPEPLIFDPARSASHAMGGYQAQVWRSVLAWMELQEEELLFLEGAEDYDIVSAENAQAVQIKNERKPITLRSEAVLSAIANAWLHQERNKAKSVILRFTTTAPVGTESGSPLGPGVCGIALWRTAQQSPSQRQRQKIAGQIGQFLRTCPNLPASFRAFLETARADQILSRIVEPIVWDTDALAVGEVKQEVRDKLLYIGRSEGIDPIMAESVAGILYETAYKTATEERDRRLTKAHFMRILHQATHVPVPYSAVKKWLADPEVARPTGPDSLPEPHRAPAGGNRLAVIVGDVLDDRQAMARLVFEERMRSWRSEYRRTHDPVVDAEFKACEHEHAVALLTELPGQTSEPYLALARLRPATIISLYPDPILERLFSSYRLRTTDSDLITFDLGPGKNDLYLLGGSARLSVGLLLGDEAQFTLNRRLDVLGLGFRDKLAMCDVLAIGLDETQYTTQMHLHTMLHHRTDRDGEITFINSNVSPAFLSRRKARQLTGPIAAALDDFGRSPRPPACTERPAPRPAPPRPFKYLDYYSIEDSAIFKGREEDADHIIREIKASAGRITILTGRSGVGKTSIVNAAITPLFEEEHDCLVVYARSGPVPEASIVAACEERTGRRLGLESVSPDKFRHALRDIFLDQERTCLIILDQAEEAFVTLGHEVMERFVANIADVLRDREVSLRFMFVIRSDYLRDMLAINSAGFPVLGTPVFLDDFTWEQARRAIADPLHTFGKRMEESLIDIILGDLDPERILPAHLSIVCDRIVSEIDRETITLAQFRRKKLGTQAIIVDHLDKSLSATSRHDRKRVESVLQALVTGDGTKELLSAEQIAARTGLSQAYVMEKIHSLIHDSRLVRELMSGGVTRYELAHETLAEELHRRLDRTRSKIRDVEDMLRREVAASQFDLDRLISLERLRVFDELRDFLLIDDKALTLIVASYAQTDDIPAYWRGEAAKLEPERIAEAVLIRPIAAKYAYLKGVLKSSLPAPIAIEGIALSKLHPPAREFLMEEIDRADSDTFALLSRYLTVLDDGHACVAILRKCAAVLDERKRDGVPIWIKRLLREAIRGLVASTLTSRELEHVLLEVRFLIIETLAQERWKLDIQPLEEWFLSAASGEAGAESLLVEEILGELPKGKIHRIDAALLERLAPVDAIADSLNQAPESRFFSLIPVLFSLAPDRAIRLAFANLWALNISQVDWLLAQLAAPDSLPEGENDVESLARGEPVSAQLVYLLVMLLKSGRAMRGTEREALSTVLTEKLLALGEVLNREFPSYDLIRLRLAQAWGPPTGAWSGAYLDPRWRIIEAFADLAGDGVRAGAASQAVWQGACRLCVALAESTSFPDSASIRSIIGRNESTAERVTMLNFLSAEYNVGRYLAVAEIRATLLQQLAEGGMEAPESAHAELARFIARSRQASERLAGALVLQHWQSPLLTMAHSEALLQGDLSWLTRRQASLLEDLADRFVPSWPDKSFARLYVISNPVITRLAGRYLSPARRVFRRREKVLKEIIFAIRSRPGEYRTRWLELAEQGAGDPIPEALRTILLQTKRPSRNELKPVGALYA